MSTALAELDRLDQRLQSLGNPGDARAEVVWAELMLDLARAVGLGLAEQNRIAEHRLRAQRRGGELLASSGIGPGIKSAKLADFGLDEHDSHRWQSIARLSEDIFETYLVDTQAAGDELTTAGLLRLVPKAPRPLPEQREFEPQPLLRFCQDLPTATIVTLILRVAFPDGETALDLTYGSGAFWDGTAHVKVTAHDLDPSRAPHGVVDFTAVPYPEDSHDVVLLDAPHLADAGDDSIMGQRFGSATQDELADLVGAGVHEAWRCARLGIVVKVCDHVHGQRLVLESRWVQHALGSIEPFEVVHQVRPEAMIDPRWQDQLSAYNNGSTYWIYRKDGPLHRRRTP